MELPVPDNECGYLAKGKHRSIFEAWIDPEGNWYNIREIGQHHGFAYQIQYSIEEFTTELYYKSYKELIDKGWISIIGWCGNIVLRGYQNMSRKQYRALLAVLGDKKLFRGWTVRGLWLCKDEAKKQAKDD